LSALGSYELLIKEGIVAKDESVSYLRSLIYDKLHPDDSSVVITGIVGCVIDARLFDMIPDVCFLYGHGRVDTSVHGGYDSFIDWMFYKKQAKPSYIDDAIPEMEWWACFKNERNDRSERDIGDLSDMFANMEKEIKKEYAIEQKPKKIGRNDPCPCGSGKKYKKCCIDAQQSKTSVARIEDRYDLLDMYPKNSALFEQMYDKDAIDIDMLVYKALHHRAIPIWVKRDREQERIGKIDYLNEALNLFLGKCQREQITSFASYDERFMVHYRSSEGVSALIDLIEDNDSDKLMTIRQMAEDTLQKFS